MVMKNRFWLVPVLVALTGLLAVGLLFAGSSGNSGSNPTTVTGRLERGVEAGCMILQLNDGTQYLLLGWSNYPPPGTRVAVTGYFDNTVASYCMQGSRAIHVVSLSISELATSTTVSSYGTATATVISGSAAQPTTITGVSFAASGYIYEVVENPQCRPQCGAPSFILTYLYLPPGTGCTESMGCYPPPRDYRLLNNDGSFFRPTAPNGTYATVTGVLATPSSWSCDAFYVPKVCMNGDIYVQSITYPTPSQPTPDSSTTTETITPYQPIPGFEPLTILVGLLLGAAVLSVTRRRRLA